jgi:hypothetical protein|tara:strand:+ start:3796 stop:4170 length:375 start_codon:yes stop_codon:yes gene_type:complete
MKIINKIKQMVKPSYKMGETEQLISDIVNLMCEQDDTDFMMAPIANKYYITNKRMEYYIVIYDFNIAITNHKFSFERSITSKFSGIILKRVKECMDADRDEFEREMFKNQLDLLSDIKLSLMSK